MRADDDDFPPQLRIAAFDQAEHILRCKGNTLDVHLQDSALTQVQRLRHQHVVNTPLDIAKLRDQTPSGRLRHQDDGNLRIA